MRSSLCIWCWPWFTDCPGSQPGTWVLCHATFHMPVLICLGEACLPFMSAEFIVSDADVPNSARFLSPSSDAFLGNKAWRLVRLVVVNSLDPDMMTLSSRSSPIPILVSITFPSKQGLPCLYKPWLPTNGNDLSLLPTSAMGHLRSTTLRLDDNTVLYWHYSDRSLDRDVNKHFIYSREFIRSGG